MAAAQRLRHHLFFERRGLPPRPENLDRDGHDDACRHLVVKDAAGEVVAAARLRIFLPGEGLGESYAAGSYDLDRLARHPAPLLELGRFCVRPGPAEALALRAAWGLLARVVEAEGVGLMFGCSSLDGAEPAAHRPALALLGRHLAPDSWAPGRRASDIVPLGGPVEGDGGLRSLPPLLRTYLAMGGRVGDHAVIDREMDTLHVLTGVEIMRVPAPRARALRALAAG